MLSNKEKGTIDTNNLDGSQGRYAKGGGDSEKGVYTVGPFI